MSKIKVAAWVIGFSFVILLLDVFRHSVLATTPTHGGPLISDAVAGDAACPIPPVERLAGNWHVTDVACTTAGCRLAHFAVGDKLKFEQDISGAKNFSIAVEPAVPGAARPHSEGYELKSDNIGNAVGPIVLAHDALDGTPLQIHWMIAKIRTYDADGFGSCKLHGLISICDEQPAKGASQCTTKQHEGLIHVDP